MLKKWRARRARKRIDAQKESYRKLSPEGRQMLYETLVAEANGAFFRNQGTIDICQAAMEVEDEEEAASIAKGQETTPFRSVTLH
jgi:hypothetical protein